MLVIDENGEDGPNEKAILVILPVTVGAFAEQLGLKPFELIQQLMEIDIFSNQRQELEGEDLIRYGEKYEVRIRIVRIEPDEGE